MEVIRVNIRGRLCVRSYGCYTHINHPTSYAFFFSLQHVNRTLSSVGGTVAAATAAWEEYSRRQEYLQRVNAHQQTQIRPRFLTEKTKHLCWAGISHPFILNIYFFSSDQQQRPPLEH